jgi:catechol 2,3-dioxygenase-like lactoylglutathione lyase family enzyme
MEAVWDHIVLNVEDEEKMVKFYNDILGFPPERLKAYRRGEVPFVSSRVNVDTIIDFFPKKMWKGKGPDSIGQPNLNHFCVACSKGDWEALKQRLEDNGIPIEDGPGKRWGARGDGISIYFRDPEDNLVEVRYYE